MIFLWFNLKLVEYCYIISGISVKENVLKFSPWIWMLYSILSPSEKELFWVTVQCSKSSNSHLRISCGTLRCHSTVYLIVKMIHSYFYLISSIVCCMSNSELFTSIMLGYIYVVFLHGIQSDWTLYCPRPRRSFRNTE